MEMKNIKAAKGLTLALAITSVIWAVPMIGYFINVLSFGILHLLVLALAIVTLVFCIKAKMPKVGVIFALVSNVLGFISGLLMSIDMYTTMSDFSSYGTEELMAEAMLEGELTFFLSGFFLGFIVWVLFIISAIILFINFASINKKQKEMTFNYNNTFYQNQPVDTTSYFSYQTEKDESVLENGNFTNQLPTNDKHESNDTEKE